MADRTTRKLSDIIFSEEVFVLDDGVSEGSARKKRKGPVFLWVLLPVLAVLIAAALLLLRLPVSKATAAVGAMLLSEQAEGLLAEDVPAQIKSQRWALFGAKPTLELHARVPDYSGLTPADILSDPAAAPLMDEAALRAHVEAALLAYEQGGLPIPPKEMTIWLQLDKSGGRSWRASLSEEARAALLSAREEAISRLVSQLLADLPAAPEEAEGE